MRTRIIAAVAGLSLVAFLPLAGLGDWQVSTHAVGDAPRHIRLAPVDGDAWPELVYTAGELTPDTSELVVWRNEDGEGFARVWGGTVPSHIWSWGGHGVPFELADLNGDGALDLFLGNANEEVWLGDGQGGFEPFGSLFDFGYADDVALHDYDDDGFVDVCILNDEAGWYYLDCHRGNGDGTFENAYSGVAQAYYEAPGDMAEGDFDGDGGIGEAVASAWGLLAEESEFHMEKLSDGAFAKVVCPDLDGDGRDDIAVSEPLMHRVRTWKSLGQGSFERSGEWPTGRRPTGIIALDHDLDGDLDLAVTNSAGRSVSILDNNGLGDFTHGALIPVGSGPSDVYAADIDLDGDPDLAVANVGDHSISILRNPRR